MGADKNLTPTLALQYMRCPRMMYNSAYFAKYTPKLSFYDFVFGQKALLRAVAKKYLESAGYEVHENPQISDGRMGARPHFLCVKGGEHTIFRVVAGAYDGESSMFTKKGAPRYEFKEIFIKSAICQKLASASYGCKVGTHLLMLKKDVKFSEKDFPEFKKIGDSAWVLSEPPSDALCAAVEDIDVTEVCAKLISGDLEIQKGVRLGNVLSSARQVMDSPVPPPCELTHNCAICPNRCECIAEKVAEYSPEIPTIFDINNLGYRDKDAALSDNIVLMSDMPDEKLTPRQIIQKQKTLAQDDTPWFDEQAYQDVVSKWKYPLHCVDFETGIFPIAPFRNLPPMRGLIYQYSHHAVDEKLNIIRHTEYINLSRGENPSIELIRKLREDLLGDEGTLVIYSQHENTYLLFAYAQIKASDAPDKEDLLHFLRSICTPTEEMLKQLGEEAWEPSRPMADLLELVRGCYYQRAMLNSNSIKKVLPSIIGASGDVQSRWSRGYNGTHLQGQRIVNLGGGHAESPYAMMNVGEDGIRSGDVALELYSEMIFGSPSPERKARIMEEMLAYCEMDTLAEVIVLQGLKDVSALRISTSNLTKMEVR